MLSIQQRLGVESEAIDGAAWQWLCMLRSAVPGIVKSFDPVKQTCVVQIATQEIILAPPPATPQNPNPGSTQNIPTTETIEPITDVPIMMMRVPGWSITLPIVEGTECLLIFADNCIDGWWSTGKVSPPYDRRRHDLSDAMALFGPWSQPNVLSNYSTTSMQIRSDDQSVMIELSPAGVNIKGPAVTAGNGGVGQGVMTAAFYEWFMTLVLPHITLPPGTPGPPATSLTSTFEAQ